MMTTVNVLALDTSTSCLSVALMRNKTTISEISLAVKVGHAGMILPVIDEILAKSSTRKDEITLIATGTGPGSFTGLRIGIATAKGLAKAIRCPLAGVPTLDIIARAALPSSMPIMPVLDAKKGEVFCALYNKDGSRLTDMMNIHPEGIAALVSEDTLFVGNGCEIYRDILIRDLGGLYHEGDALLWYPRASVLAGMALSLPVEGLSQDVQPLYIRASDATLLLERMKKASTH
jgi:tRNA threonylcarbamoyladenosine biosynthesis protein TsaB